MEVKATDSSSHVQWVYARDGDLVTLVVTEDRGGFTLHRLGPDAHDSTQWCADSWVLSDALLAVEAHLLALGYALEQSPGPTTGPKDLERGPESTRAPGVTAIRSRAAR